MRVYEFSKEYGVTSKELLELLNKHGFTLQSHMSVLSPEAQEFLVKEFSKNSATQAKKETISPAKPEPKQQIAKESMETTTQQKPTSQPVAPTASPKIQPKTEAPIPTPTQKKEISSEQKITQPSSLAPIILEPMSVADLAVKVDKPITELIMLLLKWGIMSNKNQLLTVDIVSKVADHFGVKTEWPVQKQQEIKRGIVATGENIKERLPVVVVVGHVDHGKTTLLDFIRKTRVASREKGGITQHLGAYEAQTPHGNIIFLDTPGHEAFSKMRVRGIKVADLAILVVAADDSVMPQTVESVKRIKEIGIPIVVAVNKMDKVDPSRLDIVKRDLAQYNLMPEEWGGDVVYVPISAKIGSGIDQLLEMIVLQTQLMELKAEFAGPGSGYVLESRLEKGRGPVATLLLQQGVVQVGDYFAAGTTVGKVTSIVDSFGKQLQKVGPSIPVQIAGFEELPQAGDFFEIVSKEARKAKATTDRKSELAARKMHVEGAKNLIIKTDTNSSKEALLESIAKLSSKSKKGFNIISAGIGAINESDIMLAADTGSEIFSLHVKAEPNANLAAQRAGVVISSYDVIYKLLESLEKIIESTREIKMVRKKIGEAVVRKVFDIKGIGVIAGSYVKEGILNKDCSVVAYRGKQKIGEGKISSLQRDKKTVKEVHSGFECGFMVEGFNDWQPEDRIECFIQVPAENK